MEQKTLDVKEKQNVAYCIPLDLRDEQIRINLKKVQGRITEAKGLIIDPIAIVAFAPSLRDTWEQIKEFKYIMTCSGAHKFLIDKGIVPTHHIDLDPRLHKLKLLGQPQKDTEYLIASTIHPQYLDALKGYNVKLWHIFANEGDRARVLPRDEWAITGGSSVGLRCLTIARFLGFVNMHIFGMDGSFVEGSTHTTEHPNAPKEAYETTYNGKKFLTTPSMLHVAQETFHELDQMADCQFSFYGEGLVQEMAKDYKRSTGRVGSLIAFNKPGLISQEYLELNKKLHEDNPMYGMGGSKHANYVIELSKLNKTTDILDYGAGKMMLQKSLPFPIFNYDPAIPEISQYPRPAAIVICTDVLEHIEPDRLKFVLEDLKSLTKEVGYFVVSTRKAAKTYANGKNAHLIVQGKDWWEKQLKKYFEIGTIQQVKDELHIVVGPKKVVVPDMEVVEQDGYKFKFLTPNEVTKWRATSLFTKEPSTIEWISKMEKGEILYDVGANVGSYSVYAGVRGVKVYSFEPEAENYSLLLKNLVLNSIEPNAYCMALSDEEKAGTLYSSGPEAGGACHSFNEAVGHDLKVRETPFTQGCFGIPLDKMIEKGLPSPDHIKIDVDGFEYKVVQGAVKTLMNGVKSVLIEINPSLTQHQEMIEELKKMGFEYDPEQVKRAERKNGTFKGVAEYVFTKKPTSSTNLIPATPEIEIEGDHNLASKVQLTAMNLEPFNYLYIEDLFTEKEYKQIISSMPEDYTEIEKSRGARGYPLRYTANVPWENIKEALRSGRFRRSLLSKFGIQDQKYFTEDILLIRDLPGYQITPHTDTLSKVLTVLIYLPENEDSIDEGTSIFIPKIEGFKCNSGKHYSFDGFTEVFRAPFKPNSALVFARTDDSFHGVFPSKSTRNVLLYNINQPFKKPTL